MTMLKLRNAAAALAVAVTFAGFCAAAQATPPAAARHLDRQHTLNDIIQAEIAIGHRHAAQALVRTGRAETVLLNAQQAGELKAPQALVDVQRAHRALLRHHAQAADAALHQAQSALTTPRGA